MNGVVCDSCGYVDLAGRLTIGEFDAVVDAVNDLVDSPLVASLSMDSAEDREALKRLLFVRLGGIHEDDEGGDWEQCPPPTSYYTNGGGQ